MNRRKRTRNQRRSGRKSELREWLVPLVILAGISLLLSLVSFLSVSAHTPDWVPFSLRSVLHADYSADQISSLVPALGHGVIAEFLYDQESTDIAGRLATLEARLDSPVPTVTPLFPQGQLEPSPTPTLPPPTRTPIPTVRPKPSATPTLQPTPTQPTSSPTWRPTTRPSPTPTKKPRKGPKPGSTEPPPAPQPTEERPAEKPPAPAPYPGPPGPYP